MQRDHPAPSSLTRALALTVAVLAGPVLAGCAPATPTPEPAPTHVAAPGGLDPDHVLVLVDEDWGPTSVPGTFDPRVVTLYADGTLIASDASRNRMLSTVAATLPPAALDEAWATVLDGGLATDRSLELPSLADAGTTRITVDDGSRVTRLAVYALGLGPADGEPTFTPDEVALRANADLAIATLRAMAGPEPYVPPALLVWWRLVDEADGAAQHGLTAWTIPVDLATDGEATPSNPLFGRCLRVEGAVADETSALLHTLAPGSVVEQGGARYTIAIRPIYPDEGATVTCQAP